MFKVNDKVILSQKGLKRFKQFKIAKQGYYAQVLEVHHGNIIRLSWFNVKNQKALGWQSMNFYANDCRLLKPKQKKAYNHPLTPIFAKKMPHFSAAPKIKKKQVDRKIFA